MFVWFGVTCDTCKDRYAQKHAKKLPTWYLVLSSRGKVSIEYPQPRVVILITLPSLQTTGSLGHRYGIRAYADLPAPLQILGNQRGDAPSGIARESGSTKETCEVRFEPVSSTTSNAMVIPSEL